MSENNPTKKAYHHGDLRNSLINAGIEMLAEGGAAALDLRKVARIVGVSHNAPYRHFADKQALLAAIAEYGFNLLGAKLKEAIEETAATSHQQVLGIARAYINFAQQNPALMREMFSGLTIERTAYPDLYATSKTSLFLIVETIKRGQERKEISEGNPLHFTMLVWSLIHGLAMLLIENQINPPPEEKITTDGMLVLSIEILFAGFGKK